MAITQDIGIVTAYGYAVDKGYQGTEDEFAAALANAGITLENITDAVDTFLNTTLPGAVSSAVGEVAAEGTTQKGLVTAEGTTQIGLVAAEGTAQKAAVQDKGNTVIASIPQDYTALSNDVDDLKSAFGEVADGYEVLMPTYNKGYLESNGNVHAQTSTNKEIYSEKMPVSAGEKIEIALSYTDQTKQVWVAVGEYNTSDAWVRRRDINTSAVGSYSGTYTVPSGVAYISLTYRTYDGYSFIAKRTSELVNAIASVDSANVERLVFAENEISDITGYVGISNVEVAKGSTQKQLLKFDLKQGKTTKIGIKLKSALSVNTYLYLQDENGNNLFPATSYSVASGNTSAETTFLPTQDYPNATLKYTVASSATTDANIEEVYVSYDTDYADLISLIGEGNNEYYGEKIVLNNDDTRKQKCNIVLWKDFLGTEIENLASYKLHMNQSVAIYDGYVFCLNENGGGIVLDYASKEILSTFSTEPTAYQHQNSAQFTNIFYDENDEFPLLIDSRCGNSGFSSGEHDYDEAQIYRIQRSGNDFTFTLINIIKFTKQTYGASWGVDNRNHRLYATATINGNWQVRENNPKCYWVFDLPSKSAIVSGTTITLTEADAISSMTIDFAVGQGLFVDGSIIYEGVQDFSSGSAVSMVWAVDVERNRIISKVPLAISWEPEGVALYGGKIYVTQKNGADTTGTNPMKIYELEF